MIDDERQSVFVFGTHVNKVNVQPVDLGDELRQRIEFCLALPPLVIGCPVLGEFLNRRELHALRFICNCFPIGPQGRRDAAAELDDCMVRNVDVERPDRLAASSRSKVRSEDPECARGCGSSEEGSSGRRCCRHDVLPRCYHLGDLRRGLNAALSSALKSSGSSHAAKWPPLSTSWK